MSEAVDLSHEIEVEKAAEFEPKAVALIKIDGELVAIEASSVKELRNELQKFSSSEILSVWKGKKLEVKKSVKISF